MSRGERAPGGRRTVLVLRALGLGDLLAGVPALRALRRAFPRPDHQLVLAMPRTLEPLARLAVDLDRVVDTAPLAPLPSELARPGVAVNLHGRGPESTHLLAALDPGRLLAFRHPEVPRSATGPVWRADEHEVARWCRMLGHFGIRADAGDLAVRPPPVELPARLRGVTVIHPGASTPARRWPPDRWGEVGREERRRGRTVVVTGSADELALARQVAEHAGLDDDAVLAGATDLLTLASLVSSAGRVLSGDTGVAHLASALGTPSVVLFGPVPPSEWGPPPGPHIALWRGGGGEAGSVEAGAELLSITVDDVLGAVSALPPERPAAHVRR